ncbi:MULTISPECIES: protein TolR [Acetobacter]|uniref:Protein TolR n=1 Tax=Acetobacter thailandicus TaxID=1502842 RepID=A0ABT3QEB8_9PROT|nr:MULTISPECIES: protein TolR [Acetobacter]MBS0960664.1 protein TolR [Acetobacter thailandicus]MBS0980279.1 protein TolR [Acetobacter thailandicus]MBS0986147.1 protein TolR [Acetobacter thailandicus]MBS1004048.1 protein TolR [Acetobacter thailandicus]MCX2563614.1 protein TolR [Acetobacter thailandicus]
MGMSSGGGGGRRRRRPMAEINVTPLVDVMLVLLIVFMVTSPMMTSGVNVDLPKTDAKPVNSDTKPITVSIRADGSLYLGETAVSPDQLVAQLKAASNNDAEHRIFVRGDTHIDYGRVMQVMGQITEGGFTHVALLAQQPASSGH